MDVGNPSNFIRIQEIYGKSFDTLKENLTGFFYTDEESTAAMGHLFKKYNYVSEPHGAIGYLTIKNYLKKDNQSYGVFRNRSSC